jgi:hypothetical protein
MLIVEPSNLCGVDCGAVGCGTGSLAIELELSFGISYFRSTWIYSRTSPVCVSDIHEPTFVFELDPKNPTAFDWVL